MLLHRFYDVCYVNQLFSPKMTLTYHILFDLHHASRVVMGPATAPVMSTYPQARKLVSYCLNSNLCLILGLCFTVVLSNILINAAENALLRTLFTPKGLSLHYDISILYF